MNRVAEIQVKYSFFLFLFLFLLLLLYFFFFYPIEAGWVPSLITLKYFSSTDPEIASRLIQLKTYQYGHRSRVHSRCRTRFVTVRGSLYSEIWSNVFQRFLTISSYMLQSCRKLPTSLLLPISIPSLRPKSNNKSCHPFGKNKLDAASDIKQN